MKRLWIILLGALLAGFLLIPGGAVAHSSHAEAHSPFEAPKVKKSLHCQLLKHHHSALPFCPHTQHVRSAETRLKTDCPDTPNGAPVQIQWSKVLLHYPTGEKVSITEKKSYSTSARLVLPSQFVDLPEKPPQHA